MQEGGFSPPVQMYLYSHLGLGGFSPFTAPNFPDWYFMAKEAWYLRLTTKLFLKYRSWNVHIHSVSTKRESGHRIKADVPTCRSRSLIYKVSSL